MKIQQNFENICKNFPTTDKVSHHGYHRFYPFFLDPLRSEKVKMIEIGVDRLGSLEFWRSYFSDVDYYGVDIRAVTDRETVYDNATVLRGDQTDEVFLETLGERIDGKANFIIDDGSHIPHHQVVTFNHLFDKVLAEGGVYIIEDIETSYWKRDKLYGYECNYGVGHPESIIEIFKRVVDCVNVEFCGDRIYAPSEPVPHSVLRQIEMISFAQNAIIVVKKNPTMFEQYYDRPYRSGNKI